MKHISPLVVIGLLAATLPSFSSAAEATHNWLQHCVRCHGEDGKGMTKIGRKLRIKDLTADRTQRRLSDDDITERVANGYKDNVGEERMPAFGEKLSEEERKALVALIRSLKTEPR